MIYAGKQIVVELDTGEVKRYLGSAYTLYVHADGVGIYFNGKHDAGFASHRVKKVTEDGYGEMKV